MPPLFCGAYFTSEEIIMLVKGDPLVNKLILLFVFDKMECPLTENTILDICCSSNNWIAYMDCKPIINQLIEHGFIYKHEADWFLVHGLP